MSERREGVVLVGLSGSGKSMVGRCLAERSGRPLIDLDESIKTVTGRTPAEHIDSVGEEAFREVERQAVADACRVEGAVIATGGGAVIDPLNRWAFMRHGTVCWLDAPLASLVGRLAADPVSRPLMAGDRAARLSALAQERVPFYTAADVRIGADAPSEVVAARVQAGVEGFPGGWRRLLDQQEPRHHPQGPPIQRVVYGQGLDGAALGGLLAPFEGRRPAVLIDRRVTAAHPALAGTLPEAPRCLELDGGERRKTFRTLGLVLRWLSEIAAERGDPLIVVGGGTIGDLGGLAAALHRRGMPLVQVPTTWLAQADSALGGKVAVDLPGAKNGVGAVWPAWSVIADTALIDSLPMARRRDGMAECLKAGLIGDPDLWMLVEDRGGGALDGSDEAARYAITERAVRLKLAICSRDPYEQGERRMLNLGHTLGHALEVASSYRLAHGSAVALGLRAVAAIAVRRGAETDLPERIDSVLHDLGFPLRSRFDPSAVRAALTTDKKRDRGRQRWILPMRVGRVQEVDDVTDPDLDRAMSIVNA